MLGHVWECALYQGPCIALQSVLCASCRGTIVLKKGVHCIHLGQCSAVPSVYGQAIGTVSTASFPKEAVTMKRVCSYIIWYTVARHQRREGLGRTGWEEMVCNLSAEPLYLLFCHFRGFGELCKNVPIALFDCIATVAKNYLQISTEDNPISCPHYINCFICVICNWKWFAKYERNQLRKYSFKGSKLCLNTCWSLTVTKSKGQ